MNVNVEYLDMFKTVKKFLNLYLYPDLHQQLMLSIQGRDQSSIQVWWKSVQ